jgi:hypothetical protein
MSALLVLTAGCGGTSSKSTSDIEKLAADTEVTNRLPIGPHKVQITQQIPATAVPASSVTVTGYVDLGADPFGRDCTLDLKLVETRRGTTTTFLVRRAPGQDAYHQVASGGSGKFKVGVWEPATSPAIPAPVLFFGPNFLSDGMPVADGAPGSYCTWRLLDRGGRLSGTDGQLAWDLDAVSELRKAGYGAYAKSVGDDIEDFAWVSLQGLGELAIEKDTSTSVLIMRRAWSSKDVVGTFEAVFTPTAKQIVEPVQAS